MFYVGLYRENVKKSSWPSALLFGMQHHLVELEQAVKQYVVHLLSLLTDNNPSRIIQDQSPRKYGTRPGLNSRTLDLPSHKHL